VINLAPPFAQLPPGPSADFPLVDESGGTIVIGRNKPGRGKNEKYEEIFNDKETISHAVHAYINKATTFPF
jgi:hypothetical protein